MINIMRKAGRALENVPHEESIFPGGEIHIRVATHFIHQITENTNFVIAANMTDSNSIMRLLLVTDALRRMSPNGSIDLVIPYVPYARQDRVCNPGESHSLKVFATIINSQSYSKVIVLDPHSDVIEALFDRLHIVTNHQFVVDALVESRPGKFFLVSPDAGSLKKLSKLSTHLLKNCQGLDFELIQADKIRDMATSKIVRTVVHADADKIKGMPCYIVDDICDGGRTFVEIARILKEMGASSVRLIVTHGIMSAGLTPFQGLIDEVYNTDSWSSTLIFNDEVKHGVLSFWKYVNDNIVF